MRAFRFLLAFLCLTGFCVAQTAPPSHGIMADPEAFANRHLSALDSRLQLSDQQKAQIRPIFVEEMKKVQTILTGSQSIEDKQQAIEKIHLETRAKVGAVLTPEQRKKFNGQQPSPKPAPNSNAPDSRIRT